eukprot:TRINITY_DN2295_c0_g1_i1.p1 TRINITY_DN2295_c0_g1~~TRINITY_DN2295_c0_g1_i1.p1  ORF type:complete len:708 (+),score=138.01 TRINITY_DN2295_c0_g1_i1:119-2242(+)
MSKPSAFMDLSSNDGSAQAARRVYGSKSKATALKAGAPDFASITTASRQVRSPRSSGWMAAKQQAASPPRREGDQLPPAKRSKDLIDPSSKSKAASAILTKRTSSSSSLRRQASSSSQRSTSARRLKRSTSSTSLRSDSRPDSRASELAFEPDTQPLDIDDDIVKPKSKLATSSSAMLDTQGSPERSLKRSQSNQSTVPSSPALRKHKTAPAQMKRRASSDNYVTIQSVHEAHDQTERGVSKQLHDDVEYILSGVRNAKKASDKLLILCQVIDRVREVGFRRHLRTYGQIAPLIAMCSSKADDTPALKLASVLLLYNLAADSLSGRAAYLAITLLAKLHQQDANLRLSKPSAGGGAAMSLLGKAKAKAGPGFSRSEYRLLLPSMKLAADAMHKKDCHKVKLGDMILMTTATMLTNEVATDDISDAVRTFKLLHCLADGTIELLSSPAQARGALEQPSSALASQLYTQGLQQALHDNPDNLNLLATHADGKLLHAVAHVVHAGFECFQQQIVLSEDAQLALQNSMKLLLTCTHDQEDVCASLGRMEWPRVVCAVVLDDNSSLPSEHQLDLNIMALSLLANLMEHSLTNRRTFASFTLPSGRASLSAAYELFLARQQASDSMETIESQEEQDTRDNVVSAYLAIFIACLCHQAPETQSRLAELASQEQRAHMAQILQEFVMFQQTAGANGGDMEAITRLIQTLQDCAEL